MIKGGHGVVPIELLWHRIAPVYRSWTTDKIPNAAAAHPHSILIRPFACPRLSRGQGSVDHQVKPGDEDLGGGQDGFRFDRGAAALARLCGAVACQSLWL